MNIIIGLNIVLVVLVVIIVALVVAYYFFVYKNKLKQQETETGKQVKNTKEFNGTRDILSDYMLKNYFQIINDYNITHVIAMKDEHLDNYMHNNGIGILLYEDEYFTVYEIR